MAWSRIVWQRKLVVMDTVYVLEIILTEITDELNMAVRLS